MIKGSGSKRASHNDTQKLMLRTGANEKSAGTVIFEIFQSLQCHWRRVGTGNVVDSDGE